MKVKLTRLRLDRRKRNLSFRGFVTEVRRKKKVKRFSQKEKDAQIAE